LAPEAGGKPQFLYLMKFDRKNRMVFLERFGDTAIIKTDSVHAQEVGLMRRITSVILVLAAAPRLLVAQKAPDSTPPAAAWNERAIVWPAADTDGTKFVFLEGRNDRPGRTFSYAYFMPAGYWEHHWHSGEVRVFVMSGALRVSYGDKLDSASARTYPAGAFLYVPAGKAHTMGADVNTIIIGIATGPWKPHYEHAASSSEHHHH